MSGVMCCVGRDMMINCPAELDGRFISMAQVEVQICQDTAAAVIVAVSHSPPFAVVVVHVAVEGHHDYLSCRVGHG